MEIVRQAHLIAVILYLQLWVTHVVVVTWQRWNSLLVVLITKSFSLPSMSTSRRRLFLSPSTTTIKASWSAFEAPSAWRYTYQTIYSLVTDRWRRWIKTWNSFHSGTVTGCDNGSSCRSGAHSSSVNTRRLVWAQGIEFISTTFKAIEPDVVGR